MLTVFGNQLSFVWTRGPQVSKMIIANTLKSLLETSGITQQWALDKRYILLRDLFAVTTYFSNG